MMMNVIEIEKIDPEFTGTVIVKHVPLEGWSDDDQDNFFAGLQNAFPSARVILVTSDVFTLDMIPDENLASVGLMRIPE